MDLIHIIIISIAVISLIISIFTIFKYNKQLVKYNEISDDYDNIKFKNKNTSDSNNKKECNK